MFMHTRFEFRPVLQCNPSIGAFLDIVSVLEHLPKHIEEVVRIYS